MAWIGFDVGGTFTDLICVDSDTGQITTTKIPSSRTRPAESATNGVIELLQLGGYRPEQVTRVVHGTTMATNALIEKHGATVGFICNQGFRDVVEIGRMFREELFNVNFEKPQPLVPRDLRFEIPVRDSVDGTELTPLDPESVRRVARHMRDIGVDAIAVGLLHAYSNPANELRVRDLILEATPGVDVTLSHEVSGEYGEYERWTTAIINAYLMPRIREYLEDLSIRIRNLGITARIEIMQSNGGIAPIDVAARLPVRLLESGPAGGVAGIAELARTLGLDRLITLDMGGTSSDVSVVNDCDPTLATERQISGLPVRAAMIDIHSIGAGGGSIATVDASATLSVGPESAGSDPGPVALGQGGERPTVTDADLVLGYLDPSRYCGGRFASSPPDAAAAARAIDRFVAISTGTSTNQAALGIISITVRNMVSAIRTITTQRGLDPREYVLVASGGAGPVHAGLVAKELRIPEVLIPCYPALLSAQGMLLADYRTDQARSFPRIIDEADWDELELAFRELEIDAASTFSGSDLKDFACSRVVDICYEGQQNSVPLTLPGTPITAAVVRDISSRLDAQFMDRYGFVPKHNVVKLVNLRVFLRKESTELAKIRTMSMRAASKVEVPEITYRRLVFHEFPEGVDAAVYDRWQLSPGETVDGPCIVEEDYSTTVVYPGQQARTDDAGNLFITTGVSA